MEGGKWRAVVTEISRMNNSGRPVLVGTTSVERSELLAKMLEEEGITYQVSATRGLPDNRVNRLTLLLSSRAIDYFCCNLCSWWEVTHGNMHRLALHRLTESRAYEPLLLVCSLTPNMYEVDRVPGNGPVCNSNSCRATFSISACTLVPDRICTLDFSHVPLGVANCNGSGWMLKQCKYDHKA